MLICSLPLEHYAKLASYVDKLYNPFPNAIKLERTQNWCYLEEWESCTNESFCECVITSNLKLAYQLKSNIALVWEGGYSRLLLLKDMVKSIEEFRPAYLLYHHKVRRHQRLDKELWAQVGYFGFRSLDELRRYPPKLLVTRMPALAALYGIDLSERERRPKGFYFNSPIEFTSNFTNSQLNLLEKNIISIRKAAGW